MEKGSLRDMLKKLLKKIDIQIFIYTVIIVAMIYLFFDLVSIDAGGKETDNSEQVEVMHLKESNTQNIYVSNLPVEMTTNNIVELTIEEAQLLMKIAWSEAGNKGIEGQLAIMNVVMNRVADENFPNTIEDVIYQKLGNHYQFTVVGNGVFKNAEPTEETHLALAELEGGKDISQGALFFEASTKKSWHKNHREFLFEDYGHRFYK